METTLSGLENNGVGGGAALDNIDNQYVEQAYAAEKWAFVSDYLRLYALKKYGGFYCDSDLEMTNSIECFRKYGFVSGYEFRHNIKFKVSPITALMGAEKNHPIICDLLDEYNDITFIRDGEMDMTSNTTRITEYFSRQYHLTKPYDGGKITYLTQDAVIFPWWYFCTPEAEKENYTIHHFNGSWVDAWGRKLKLKFGSYKLVRFKKLPNRQGELKLLCGEKKVWEMTTHSGKKYMLLKLAHQDCD